MNQNKVIDITSASIANIIPAYTGLCGDVVTAVGGAVIAPIIQNKLSEAAHWAIGCLQRKKVEISTNLICEKVVQNAEEGKEIRRDTFFELNHDPLLGFKESSASKLIEGTLLKAKEEYNSKKLPYLSYLTANILYMPNVSEEKAFVLLDILNNLSYRQLCALAIFYRRGILPVGRWEARLKATSSLHDYYDVAYEFLNLKDSMLIEQNMPNGGMGIGISDYRITALGKDVVIAADLNSIPQTELSPIEDKISFITSSLR